MARTKKLTREFDSAIDRDFLQNKILYEAFAKLAAEQDMYNMSKGYPINGTQGELPIQSKYGGKQKFQGGGYPYLTPQGYQSIDQYENTSGNPQGKSMNKGAGYSQGLTSPEDLAAVQKVQNYIDTVIGRDAWEKMPEELKVQVYSMGFNSVPDDRIIKGLAQAAAFDQVNAGFDDADEARRSLGRNDALDIIKKADWSDPNISKRYRDIVPMQLQSMADNYDPNKNGITTLEEFAQGQDIYGKTWRNRADDIHKNYQQLNQPTNTGISDIDDNEIRKIMADAAAGDADAIEKSKSITQDDINRIAEMDNIINQTPVLAKGKRGFGKIAGSVNPKIPEKPYVNNFTPPHALEDRLNADRTYQDTTFDKAAKWGALAPGLVGIAAAFQNNKKFGKFPHYTPKDLDIEPIIRNLQNTGQLATNNYMDRLRNQPGSAGSYLTNAAYASGQGQENTAKAIQQLSMEAAARNKAAKDSAGVFNAQQDTQANRAQEEMRGAKWTAAEQGLNSIVQNLGAYSQEDKANWLGEQARLDQLAFMQDFYPKRTSKYGGKLKKLKK